MSSEAVKMVVGRKGREEPEHSQAEVKPGIFWKGGQEDVFGSWAAILFRFWGNCCIGGKGGSPRIEDPDALLSHCTPRQSMGIKTD